MTPRLTISSKLIILCLAFAMPMSVMFVLMTKAKLADINFASKETVGNAVVRPLEDVLEHMSRYRRLWARSKQGDKTVAEALRAENAAVAKAIDSVVAAERLHGEALQFTPEGLGKRQRGEFTAAGLREKWKAVLETPESSTFDEAHASFRLAFNHVRTMITHAGDTSNLVLDPDLDTYYLIDVTLLALPPMEDRLQQIAVDLDDLAFIGHMTPDYKLVFATHAVFFQEAEWDRITASTTVSLSEDANFHGVSPSLATLRPHLEVGALHTTRIVNKLETLSQGDSIASLDIENARAEVEALHTELFAFHRAALDEEDKLFEARLTDLRTAMYLGYVLIGASLLLAGVFAYVLASNIARRVRRIAATTEAFAHGDVTARVGEAGTDELGTLAHTFDAMTDRIGGLTTEVRRRADELAEMNKNLENTVEERTSQLRERNDEFRLILDNVSDGMFTVDMEGVMLGARSAVVDSWLGAPAPGAKFSEHIAATHSSLAASFQLGIEEIAADIMPIELTMDQLPHDMVVGAKHLRFTYQLINDEGGKPSRVLVVLSDVTLEIESKRAAARQEDLVRIFNACKRDQSGFLEFFVDARERVSSLAKRQTASLAETKRTLHTLKGNCALFGVLVVAALCHDIETHLDEATSISDADLERLSTAWREVASTVTSVIGEDTKSGMLVGEAEYAAIIKSIAGGKPRSDVLAAIVRWKLEPVELRLARFADQAVRIAKRLGKDVAVIAEGNDVRLCAQTWAPIWSSLVHVIRNGLDHGIETPEERVASGKPAQARLWLRARESGNRVVVEIADDGRGISWERLAAKARAAGLPSATRADLVEAIFADGVSTKEVTTDLSGRGVGMAAVRTACRQLGGDIEIESMPSKGTIVRCVFPNGVRPEESVAELLSLRCVSTIAPPLKRAS